MHRYEPLTEDIREKIHQEAVELLTPLAEKYGICLDFVKETCSGELDSLAINARFSLPKRPDSVATLKEEKDFRCYAEGFGLREEWLGKEFQRGRFTYKVAGLMIHAASKCVVLQRSDGARCQEDRKLVSRYLG